MLNLKSKITIKILAYYFMNNKKSHYINELAKIIDVDPGNLFRKLKELEGDGLLISESRGNQKYFELNHKYPFLAEYKKLYESTYGFPETLKAKIKKLAGLNEAYIFGSFAKGNFTEQSDIDLLLVGDHKHGDVFDIIHPLEKTLGREINVIDFSVKEFIEKKKNNDDFIAEVLNGKIIKLI